MPREYTGEVLSEAPRGAKPYTGEVISDDDMMKRIKRESKDAPKPKAKEGPSLLSRAAAGPAGMLGLGAPDVAGAALEPLLSMGSGAVAAPASGLAGILGALMPGREGQGARWAEKVGQGMTYQPRSEGGRHAMTAISAPFEMISKGANYAGEKTAEATGSPLAGAGLKTLLEGLPQLLGAKGASRLKPGAPPEIPPGVKTLLDRDVTMTPGQISPKLARVEEGLQSVPVLGDIVKNARGRGVESFNRSTWNEALTAAGEKKMPDTVKTGHQASQYVREKLGDRYDDLLGKMVGRLDNAPPKNALPAPGQLGQKPAPTLRQELTSLLDLAKQSGGLPSKEMRELRRIVNKEVIEKFDKNGTAPGETLKSIQETLRVEKDGFAKGTPYERRLAQAIKEVDASVRRMIRDTNPKYAAELDKIDAGYARFKIAQRASGAIGTQEGVFKPSTYDRAVKASDKSKDHARYSEGRALQQDVSTAAKKHLSDTLPDSGSPFRLALMHLLTHGKAAGATLGSSIPLSLLYSPQGVALMQRLLTNPPAAGRAGAIGAPIGAAQYGQIPPPPQQGR